MMKSPKTSTSCIVAAVLAFAVASCGGEESESVAPKTAAPASAAAQPRIDVKKLLATAKEIFGPLPDRVASEDNPSNISKMVLGRLLFNDPRLSKDGKFSCATCHDLGNYGVDGKVTTDGPGGHPGYRNVPTVINAAMQGMLFWDARAITVEEQAGMALLNPAEMGMADEASVMAVIESIDGYKQLFKSGFRGEDQPRNFTNVAKAIAAFERSLLTPSRFDSFVSGKQNALQGNELTGLKLFLDAQCTTCHIAPTVGGMMIQKLGNQKPYPTEDKGYGKFAEDESYDYFFKVPQLRNVTETGPYMHDGSIESLAEMVRIMGEIQLSRTFDDAEVAALVAFMGTLTGKVDPKLAEPLELMK